jgi:uncharacterized protein (DUF3084 family)
MTETPDFEQTLRELETARQERNEARTERADLAEKLAYRMDENARLRKLSDENHANGLAWKKQAEELTSQLRNANTDAMSARNEAAELRGYIRRVNELDPKRIRNRVEILDKRSASAGIQW